MLKPLLNKKKNNNIIVFGVRVTPYIILYTYIYDLIVSDSATVIDSGSVLSELLRNCMAVATTSEFLGI